MGMPKAIYFSNLQGKQVFDCNEKKLGILSDLVIADGEALAEVIAIVVKADSGKKKINWNFVESIEFFVYLNKPLNEIEFESLNDSDLLVSELLLDKQLIDANGLKVVRVNDIILSKVEGKFCVSSVDISNRAILRRLGIEKFLLPLILGMNEKILPWSVVQPLNVTPSQNLQLSISRAKISKSHPADIADFLTELSHRERALVFNSLDERTAADTLAEAKPEVLKSVVHEIKSHNIAKIVQEMEADEIVQFLGFVSREKGNEILNMLDEGSQREVKKMLGMPKKSAGKIMTFNFVVVPKNFTVKEVLEQVRRTVHEADFFSHIYVVDEKEKLLGVLPLRNIVIAKPGKKAFELMNDKIISVHTNSKFEEVAKIFSKYRLISLPVTDNEGKLVGVITIDDVLNKMIPSKLRKHKVKRRPKQARKEEIKNNNSAIDLKKEAS